MNQNIQDVYEAAFERHGLNLRDARDPVYAKMLEYLKPDMHILDACCGSGKYSLSLKRDGYEKLKGYDIATTAGDNLEVFKQMDLNTPDWGYADGEFNAAVSVGAIHYATDLDRTFNEINRILSDRGIFLGTFHTRYSLFTLDRIIRRTFVPDRVAHLQGVRFLPWWHYSKIMRRCGFEILDVDGYDMLYVPNFIKNLLKKKGFKDQAKGVRTNVHSRERFVPAKVKATLGYHAIIVARKI